MHCKVVCLDMPFYYSDPKIVAGWPFSGWDGGDIGHTWLIKGVQAGEALQVGAAAPVA